MWRNNLVGLKQATRIITISEFSKGEILQALDYPAEKIEVILDAVDHTRYYKKRDRRVLDALHIPPECQVILYVGTEEPRQNFPTLLKALARLKKRMLRVKLLKIGDPYSFGAREKNLTLIRDLKLEKEVIFMGYVAEEELPKWYNASDLLVYPCSYAGFGLPPLEAMACGTPVITSNTTSLPEVVGDAGIMIEPTNAPLLADKMWEVLSDQDMQEQLSKMGMERAKLFNWEHSAQKTLKLYEEVYHGI
jgi:glycosyltransferase involved in cell wall biosynthesis